jgi:hypothetical protein
MLWRGRLRWCGMCVVVKSHDPCQYASMTLAPSTSDVAILVVSCDAFRDLWHPFFTCFFKYWPACPYPLHLGSNFATYADARVRSLCVGKDLDYSSNLLAMLEGIEQEWLILWIEDRVLSAPVHTERVSKLIALAQEQGAAYLKLLANHPFAMSAYGSSEIGEITRGTPYRACITVALWHKPALVALLRPGESAWDIERQGSERSSALPGAFLALSFAHRHDPPLADEHLIIKGRLIRGARDFIRRESLQDCMRGRPLQTLRSSLYVKAYLASHDLRSHIKWWWQRISQGWRSHASGS